MGEKESIETDKCVRFTRAPAAAFCLKFTTMRPNNFWSIIWILFVCLLAWSKVQAQNAVFYSNWDWQMCEVYESSHRCVLLEAHHNVARTALKSKLHFCILFRLFPHTNVAILINITDTTQIQSKSWFWLHCVLTHTK